ncbi:MAG: alpha/beta hydrolase [Bacteroidales bacterium]
MKASFLTYPEGRVYVSETSGRGNPVVFIHGNSLSSQIYQHQADYEHFSDHRLVFFDFPGHGESGNWSNPEKSYSAAGFVEVLLELTSRLGVQNALFVGHSLGGHILLHAARYLQDASGFCFFGITPFTIPPRFDLAFLPHPAVPLLFQSYWTAEDRELVGASLIRAGGTVPFEIVDSLEKSIPAVREHIAASISKGQPVDETLLLAALDKPVTIFHGEKDQLVNREYLEKLNVPMLWNGKPELITEAGHCPQLENPVAFNTLLKRFIDYCTHPAR